MLRLVVLLSIVLIHSNCVTIHSSTPSPNSTKSLTVSCSREHRYDTAKIKALDCAFENTTKEWQSLKVSSITFPPEVRGKVLTPEQIAQYMTAIHYQNSMDDHNTALALSGLVVAGIIVAGTSPSSSGVAAPAALTAGAAATTIMGRGIAEGVHGAKQARMQYGNQHVLGEKTGIPGELFVRRALLIEIEDKFPQFINLCFEEPTAECLQVEMVRPNHQARATSISHY